MSTHHLTEKDLETRTAVCSVCGPVDIRKASRGWQCGVKKRAGSREWMQANRGRRSEARSPHRLDWKSTETGDGLCSECGPVKIVAYGRGWACAEGTTRRAQGAPTPYCPDCRDDDGKIIPLADGRCPRCVMSLNQQLLADADLHRQIDRSGYVDEAAPLVPLVVGHWADPYQMPDFETAVPRWKTLGSRTEVATAV